jgi:hypothetical protein
MTQRINERKFQFAYFSCINFPTRKYFWYLSHSIKVVYFNVFIQCWIYNNKSKYIITMYNYINDNEGYINVYNKFEYESLFIINVKQLCYVLMIKMHICAYASFTVIWKKCMLEYF